MRTKPCVGCGRQVPEQGSYPYPDCSPDCPLAKEWRREHGTDDDYERGYLAGIKAAAAFIDELEYRMRGQAREPMPLDWIAGRIRALAPTAPTEKP